MAKVKKVLEKKQREKLLSAAKLRSEAEMQQVDELVKREGEADAGGAQLKLCPRCGSGDLGVRRIDIPGFAPEVQVCNRCGFRSESAVEVAPVEYFEEVEEDESHAVKIEEIEKRLQSSAYAGKEPRTRKAKEQKAAKTAARPARKTTAKRKPKPTGKKKR